MAKSVFGVVRNKRLIFRQELRLRNKPNVFPIAGDDRHVEVAGAFELLQHHRCRVIIVDELFRLNHQILDMHFIIQILLEDNLAVVVHHKQSREEVVLVDDHEEVALAVGDDISVGTERAVYGNREDVGVNGLMPRQFAECVFVFIVGAEVVFFG